VKLFGKGVDFSSYDGVGFLMEVIFSTFVSFSSSLLLPSSGR